ncbi:VirB4 family type IV secretion system protein [Faecalibaculum rodentium]|uniref:VirB4 family type IV secretion system protein n=1 Tax=Faecalibaculum rodentium TaxID=1702221 RepID=UPI0025AB7489|nr:ATP-binding protein [Faecalibaculum rodentium]
MSMRHEENDIYIIPPNFIDTGTVFGGTIKLRNAAEALVLSLLIGFPVFHIPATLTTRIIVACLTVLPAALFAVIGINGESLSSFVINFFVYLKNRRIVGLQEETGETPKREKTSGKPKKAKKPRPEKKVKPKKEDYAEEFGQFKERRQAKQAADEAAGKHQGKKRGVSQIRERMREEPEPELVNPSASYLPIRKIENGIIYTKDRRYVKIIEVIPINFLLRSAREQRGIIYSFISYLKISPVKLQFKVLTRRADINKHLETLREEIRMETDERCLALQHDYENLIRRIGSREAITRRFFIIFEYELFAANRGNEESDAISALTTAVRTAKTYLQQCGNELLVPDNEDEMAAEVFYSILNRKTSVAKPLSVRVNEVIGQYINAGRRDEIGRIPAMEFIVPETIDYTHGSYVIMDGTYHTYLLVPSGGYRPQVCAGWISLLVNAGEGIDVDIFFDRQPKDRIQQKLGQQLRINRSKIKDTSDTNSDFDDLDSAIRSGYFLKEGLANNEDFYYMNILITITADSLEELEWRTNEMKKLMLSHDMEAVSCHFREEQALLSALPLVSLEKKLFERSKRNILTGSVAGCYPFTSFEMCDDNGILLGVNKHNNSLIIVDIFNSRVYKNANMAILGTSGAGKTFTMQLMALRMRRRNIQVFIIAPLKGHEFHRACSNIGGEFIQISPASRNCINIMEIRKVDSSANDILDGPQTEKSELAAKIQRLHIFFSLLIPDMTHEERQLLDEALIQTYNRKGITHNNESLPDPKCPDKYREMPVLEDVFNILKDNPDTKRLANIMNRLVHGSASTFNQQTNVNLDNKYTVLDISELTGDLLTVGMFVALDYVWDKAKEDRTVEKAIFIDETWQLIGAASNRLAAEFVLEIFKIIRGYGGSAICATQDLNDFFALEDGKYGKGIINNSKTKIVLNLEDEEAMRVQSILHLSEAETMAVTHFERGNGLISTNNNNVTVEFKASELEKELITTDRNELKKLLEREKQRRQMGEAV